MKNTLLLVAIVGLLCCKEEPSKEICYNCLQTITTFEGTKQPETKKTQEMCGFTAKNFFEKNFTFSNDFGNLKEFSIGKCTEKK